MLKNSLAATHVFPPWSYVSSARDGGPKADLAVLDDDIFLLNDSIRAEWNRSAGKNAANRSRRQRSFNRIARSNLTFYVQFHRMIRSCVQSVFRPQGVSIHGRIIEPGNIEGSYYVVGKHAQVRGPQITQFGFSRTNAIEDLCETLIK
jgi:hypothetical protein